MRGRTRDLPLRQSTTPFCIIDDGPPSFAVKGTLHEPIGDNQSRNTQNVPPERSLQGRRSKGREGQSAAAWPRPPDLATCVCICVLICPNLMRDRLAQTSLPLLRFALFLPSPPLSSPCAWRTSPGAAHRAHKHVEKLDRETSPPRRRCICRAAIFNETSRNAGLFAALAV